MSKYSAPFKELVVCQYKKNTRGYSFRALAKKYGIKGGAMVVRDWWLKWTRGGETVEALQPQVKGHRRQKLTEKEEKLITDYVEKKNEEKIRVDYEDVHEHVIKKTKKDVALRTIQETGKELGISWKKTTRALSCEGQNCDFLLPHLFSFRSSLSRSSDPISEKMPACR